MKHFDPLTNVATIFNTTSFCSKRQRGETGTLKETYADDESCVVYLERKRYLLIEDAAGLEEYRHPENTIPSLHFSTAAKMPRATYVNVQKTYAVELHHLSFVHGVQKGAVLQGYSIAEIQRRHSEWLV